MIGASSSPPSGGFGDTSAGTACERDEPAVRRLADDIERIADQLRAKRILPSLEGQLVSGASTLPKHDDAAGRRLCVPPMLSSTSV